MDRPCLRREGEIRGNTVSDWGEEDCLAVCLVRQSNVYRLRAVGAAVGLMGEAG